MKYIWKLLTVFTTVFQFPNEHICTAHILSICLLMHKVESLLTSSWCSTLVKVLWSTWTLLLVWSFVISRHLGLAPKWFISDHSYLQIIMANIINLVDRLFPVRLIFPSCLACSSVIHHSILKWSSNTMRGEQHVLLISRQCLELTEGKGIWLSQFVA